MQVDLGSLGFAEGGYLLVKRASRRVAPGELIRVTGDAEDLDVQLRAWCRTEGHRFDWQQSAETKGQALIHAGMAETERWAGAVRVSGEGDANDDSVAEHPPRSWGLAARGSTIEADAGVRLPAHRQGGRVVGRCGPHLSAGDRR